MQPQLPLQGGLCLPGGLHGDRYFCFLGGKGALPTAGGRPEAWWAHTLGTCFSSQQVEGGEAVPCLVALP